MKSKLSKMHIVLIAIGILLIAWVAVGYFSSRVETLRYTVLNQDKEYEIRQLPEHIIAETTVSGNFDNANAEAFNILAGYIFGKNRKQQSISMTSPVIENESEKIAMTGPVLSNDAGGDERTFAFVMPAEYTLEALPEPLDSRIAIRQIEAKKIAVISFSGFYSEKKIEAKKELLKNYLNRDNLEYSTISWAGYNPPWTPPFMRLLEVWAELK